MTSVVYRKKSKVTMKQLQRYMESPTEEKVSHGLSLDAVKLNTVYVFRIDREQTCPFWRFDGYQWHYTRAQTKPNGKNPWCKVLQHQLKSNGKMVDFHRYEYHPIGCEIAPPNTWMYPNVVVHYRGTYSMEHYSGAPHGNLKSTPQKAMEIIFRELVDPMTPGNVTVNQKSVTNGNQIARKSTAGIARKRVSEIPNNDDDELEQHQIFPLESQESSQYFTPPTQPEPSNKIVLVNSMDNSNASLSDTSTIQKGKELKSMKEFQRSNPSVKNNLLQKLKAGKLPSHAYNETVREACISHGVNSPTLIPRNKKQVYNLKQGLTKLEKHDDFFEVFLFAKEHPEVVLKFELVPDVVLIIVLPEMCKHFKSLAPISKPAVLHYDTTFDIGLFYTSILSFRHPSFNGKPVIPLAVMFHEAATENSHQTFFKVMCESSTLKNFRGIIVTDRERGIRNAIASHCQNARNIFCWNHFKKNIGDWALKHYSSEIAKVYKKDVISLLQAESHANYDQGRSKRE